MRFHPIAFLGLVVACKSAAPVPPKADFVDISIRGGRIYDNWKHDLSVKPESKDAALPRLKDTYGWDLRGSEGIYGAKYLAKATVASRNWLTGKESAEAVFEILKHGDPMAQTPGYGDVLDDDALQAAAAYIVGVRDGKLASPTAIWQLAETEGRYQLLPNADVLAGHVTFANQCADCHGNDGTAILFDDGEYSLGSHARQKAYEDWAKLLSGHPGSDMSRQLQGNGQAMSQGALDVLAALCDRARYPVGDASKPDVAEGDPRCGAYLK